MASARHSDVLNVIPAQEGLKPWRTVGRMGRIGNGRLWHSGSRQAVTSPTPFDPKGDGSHLRGWPLRPAGWGDDTGGLRALPEPSGSPGRWSLRPGRSRLLRIALFSSFGRSRPRKALQPETTGAPALPQDGPLEASDRCTPEDRGQRRRSGQSPGPEPSRWPGRSPERGDPGSGRVLSPERVHDRSGERLSAPGFAPPDCTPFRHVEKRRDPSSSSGLPVGPHPSRATLSAQHCQRTGTPVSRLAR